MACISTHRELAFELWFISQSSKQIIILLPYRILNWDGEDRTIFFFRERHSGILVPGLEAGKSMKVDASHCLSSETLYHSEEIAEVHVVNSLNTMSLIFPINLYVKTQVPVFSVLTL